MRVKFDDLEDAMLFAGYEWASWLDSETGIVVSVGPETASMLDTLNIADPRELEATLDVLVLQGQIENDDGREIDLGPYRLIDPPNSDDRWKWMEEFILERVADGRLHDKLAGALSGRRPFRRFKDVLIEHPKAQAEWFEFEADRLRRHIEDWARSEGVEIE